LQKKAERTGKRKTRAYRTALGQETGAVANGSEEKAPQGGGRLGVRGTKLGDQKLKGKGGKGGETVPRYIEQSGTV